MLNSLNLCLQEERKQASFEQQLKVANAEREVHETIFIAITTILDYYRLIFIICYYP